MFGSLSSSSSAFLGNALIDKIALSWSSQSRFRPLIALGAQHAAEKWQRVLSRRMGLADQFMGHLPGVTQNLGGEARKPAYHTHCTLMPTGLMISHGGPKGLPNPNQCGVRRVLTYPVTARMPELQHPEHASMASR